MKKWMVDVKWSGYQSGTATYIVEADTEEAAMKNPRAGDRVANKVLRDDTSDEALEASGTN